MIYFERYSWLLATNLRLKEIGEILNSSKSEEEIESKLEVFGKKYLERYKVFKEYKSLVSKGEVKESIIPIIGALPCVGKTTIAREIATAFGIGNVLGGDAIRASYRELIDPEKHPEFFCSIYGAWQYVGDKTETKENIILGFYKQSEIMNRLMERIVADRGIRDGESMVIEYLHFLPSQYNKKVLNHPSVIPIVLKLESEEIHRERIKLRDVLTHLKGNAKRLLDVLDKYRMMQEVQCEDAKKHGVPVVPTDNFSQALDKTFDIITERIKLLNKIKETEHEHIEIIKKIKEERKRNPEERK